MQPVPGDRGDAVDQVVEAYLGQRLGARPEMERLAVGQPEGGEGRLLVEGPAAEALEDPAVVFETGLLGLLPRVPQHRGQQVSDRHVGRHGEVDGAGRGTHGQVAQSGHGSVGHTGAHVSWTSKRGHAARRAGVGGTGCV